MTEIEPTLGSVFEQTYPHVEYVVVDGASTDGTLQALRAATAIDVLISEPDHGIYDAMNKGLKAVTGDFVLFLNAGDHLYSKYVLEMTADHIRRHPLLDVVYGGLEIRSDGAAPSHFTPPNPSDAADFLITRSLPHQATFARRRVFGRTRTFDTRYQTHADYEWFLKVALDADLKIGRLPFQVASFATGGASSQLSTGERERHLIQNSFPPLQTASWLRRRIDLYQEHYIDIRLELERTRKST